MSEKGIPSPFFNTGRPPLPPAVEKEVDEIARAIHPLAEKMARLVKKHNLGCFELGGGVDGIEVHLSVHNPDAPHTLDSDHAGGLLEALGLKLPPGAKPVIIARGKVPADTMAPMPIAPTVAASQPATDLLAGIESLLRRIYTTVEDADILGAIYSPHKSAAMEIAKIMDAARARDRAEVRRAIQENVAQLLARFQ